MLKLYREASSPPADTIEAELQDILLAYDRVILTPDAARETFGSRHSLPVLTDNERTFSGKEQIASFLTELRQLMHDWQAYQGDSCYIDDEGQVC
jgi:hypothetical protein